MEFHRVALPVGSGIENLVEKKKKDLCSLPPFFSIFVKQITQNARFFFSFRFLKGNRRALQYLTRVNFREKKFLLTFHLDDTYVNI